MIRKDLLLVTVVGVAIGVLIQPMLTTLRDTIVAAGIEVTVAFRILILVGFSIFAPIALLIAHLLGKLWGVLYQFAKFAAVGTLNTMIDFGILNLLIAIFGVAAGIWFSVFKAISFVVATGNSFVWNKFWTFGSKDKMTVREAAKFYTIAVVGWILNVLAASLVVNAIPRPETLSVNLWANVGALVGVGAAFLWNFLGYKFVVFKEKEIGEE